MPDLEDAGIFDDAYDDRDKDQLGKFDEKLDEWIFVGYFTTSKDFRVYNIRTRKVEENLHIAFLENKPMIAGGGPEWLFDLYALSKSMNYAPVSAGKQHKVSFKSILQNSISQPVFMLHMDLFGPTSVSSIMHKKYCLVITDDYSRFTWAFFLATKDETSKESSIRHILRLDDAEGTYCLTNAKIFEGLARMSAKTTSWDEFSSTMASVIICLATNQKFNISRYTLLSLVKNIEADVSFFMFPRVGTGFSREVTSLFDNMLVQSSEEVGTLQLMHNPYPSLLNHQLPNPKRNTNQRGSTPKNLSGEGSLKLKELMDLCTNLSNKVLDLESEVLNIKFTYKAKIEKLESRVERLEEENRVLKELKGVYSIVDSDEPAMEKEESSKHGKKIADIDADVEINLEKIQAEAYNLDLDHQEKVLSMLDVNDEEPAIVEEVLKVVKAAKLITEVVTTAGVDVNAASVQDTSITAAEATKVIVLRKRRRVIIQDPKETTITVTVQPNVQAKDKGKAILIKEPKPLKRQVQINLDAEVARQLEVELNADIYWNDVIEQVKRSERLTDAPGTSGRVFAITEGHAANTLGRFVYECAGLLNYVLFGRAPFIFDLIGLIGAYLTGGFLAILALSVLLLVGLRCRPTIVSYSINPKLRETSPRHILLERRVYLSRRGRNNTVSYSFLVLV
nr:ribonuclease H-like domain-containing protein [Tanacetum cinerariifolium]